VPILIAGGGVAYALLPWESWLPRKRQLPPRRNRQAGAPAGKGLIP
jgi:hypothetical protein